MSDEYTGWRRDRQRNDDRGWQRRNDENRRRERDYNNQDAPRYGRSDYGDHSGTEYGRDWGRRGYHRENPDGRSRDDRWSYGNDDRGRYGRSWRDDWDRNTFGPRDFGQAGAGAWGFDEWDRDPGWDYGWSNGYGRDFGARNARRDWYDRDRDSWGGYSGFERRSPRGERGWWDRASDEVSSWFGDEEAGQRRAEDSRRDEIHRGRGPRGYTRSDERIREDVSDRLTDNPVVDASDIEISVQGGEVTLNGHVDSRYSKRLAEDVAADVSGVRHVQNNLRVREIRDSISGTYSGISEGGRTSDVGRTSSSGISSSSGSGNTTGSTSGSTSGNAMGSSAAGTTTTSSRTSR